MTAEAESMSRPLVRWYRANKRSFPWRDRQDDSYAVWVSEIMLQQTTVTAVIGFYNRWMERFPTLQSLADAPLDEVLKYWAGLGYYARARNLKMAAEIVVRDWNGVLPDGVGDLMKLPGIGRYTAGAISSIAHQLDSPIVDVNVVRVLCRFFALRGDPKSSASLQRELWTIATNLIPAGESRDFNQALMELGGTVCTLNNPNCANCPVAAKCEGLASGTPTDFPELSRQKKVLDVVHCTCIVESGGKLLITQRPLDQLWGGLWEMPRVTVKADEEVEDAALRAVLETAGINVNEPVQVGFHKHGVSNLRVSLYAFQARLDATGITEATENSNYAWVKLDDLSDYAISSPQREILAQWSKNKLQGKMQL